MSKIEVNTVEPQCGTTLTLGGSGDTVALGSGASQTGFGRTGTVDWQTGSIKTTTFTATNGEGYFADTSSGAFTMNLPAGSAGAIVSVADYTRTFVTYNLTVSPDGSEKIGGVAADASLNVDGQSATFVYVDANEGWINIQETQTSQTGTTYICASVSGACNTLTTAPDCANAKIAKFVGPGTFTVNTASNDSDNNTVSYLVVAGGGGASAGWQSGGGVAGGYREIKSPTTPYTASPLDGYSISDNRVIVSGTAYPITVGGGGTGATVANNQGTTGNASIFSTITSAGGGKAGAFNPTGTPSPTSPGEAGGSGGGAGRTCGGATGGAGNTPPVNPSQGFKGGDGANPYVAPWNGGGGGGATAQGADVSGSGASAGGAGATTEISSSPVAYAGGGGGGGSPTGSPGGTGGGGAGGNNASGTNGTCNTGGGGGGSGNGPTGTGGNGGSGIVYIRYKFQ